MNKKRTFILTALILAVCIVFCSFAIACDNKGDGTTDSSANSTLLFTNGTFTEGTSSSSVLSSPTNWTGAAGSTTSSTSATYTPSGEDDLTKGVVGVSTSEWKALQKQYKHITVNTPGVGQSSAGNDELDDTNVLMINNRTATSYKYTSDSHTLDADSYYKLSVDVKTILGSNTDPLAGAYIYVNGAAYAGWEAIDTASEWKTYTLYIETSELASGTITVILSLGIGNGSTGHLTQGYAFFDNVVLEKISEIDEDDEDAKAYTKDDFAKQEAGEYTAKYTMKVADSEFDYASSTTSVPYTPSKYTQVSGYGSGDSASTSSTYLTKGIIDTSTFSTKTVADSLSALSTVLERNGLSLATLEVPEQSFGSRMLYIQNKLATAFGYRADVKMNFDLNKFYKVSVFARTFLDEGVASARLTDGTNTDSNDYTIEIDTDGEWVEYSFYVQANQFRSTQLQLELWLGFGGSNDTDTHAKGVALFDLTTIEEISEQDYINATNSTTDKKIDLSTNEKNMTPIDLNDFQVGNTDLKSVNQTLLDYSKFEVINTGDSEELTEFPGKPVNRADTDALNSKVLVIDNFRPTATTLSTLTYDGSNVDTSKLITIAPNKAYAISMYIKTKDIASTKGLTVALLRYNEKYETGDEFANAYSTVATFSNLNTENLEDDKGFNDYTLFTFYVLGDKLEEVRLGISITMGTGDGSDYSTLVMGYGYVSSMNVESIAYSQYSSATSSTTVTSVDLSDVTSTNEVSSNGYFKNVDISSTINLYGNDIFASDGALNTALGMPSNWSVNSSSKLTEKDNDDAFKFDYMAGILNLNNESQYTALGIDNVNTFYDGITAPFFSVENNPTVLAIKKGESIQTLGFTSNSISLTAKSYYAFMVYAKATMGSEFSISLKTATSGSTDDKLATLVGDNQWHQYMIFIETGISSASVTLSLNADSATYQSSTVFFTGATYTTIDEDVFAKAQEQSNQDWLAQSWLVDSFDDVDSADSIAAAKNFIGESIDSDAASDSDTLVSGVIDRNKTNYSDIDLDVDGDDEAIVNAIFNNDKTDIGDRVLVIYNKEATAYGYTSNSADITPGKYYKISIWVLTYKLALNSSAGDDIDENFVPTATITLKANNKTYEFGRKLTSESSEYDNKRIVNTSTYDDDGNETIGQWTQYSFYIYAEDDIDDTTATLTVSLGFKGSNYYLTGYLFVDNFSVEEIDEENFIARKDVYAEAENGDYFLQDGEYLPVEGNSVPDGATLYKKLTDSEVAKEDNNNNSILANDEDAATNFRIVFTKEDSTAEPPEDDETPSNTEKDPQMWLWISLGAVSGIIVIIVVIVVIKKLIPKKKKKLIKNSKNKKTSGASKRDQFSK